MTPGPWRVVAPLPEVFATPEPPDPSVAFIICDHLIAGQVIATVNKVDGEQQAANAQLIAAAPDLLAAAKHAATEWRLHAQLTDSCRVLEAAISKAEGAQ